MKENNFDYSAVKAIFEDANITEDALTKTGAVSSYKPLSIEDKRQSVTKNLSMTIDKLRDFKDTGEWNINKNEKSHICALNMGDGRFKVCIKYGRVALKLTADEDKYVLVDNADNAIALLDRFITAVGKGVFDKLIDSVYAKGKSEQKEQDTVEQEPPKQEEQEAA